MNEVEEVCSRSVQMHIGELEPLFDNPVYIE